MFRAKALVRYNSALSNMSTGTFLRNFNDIAEASRAVTELIDVHFLSTDFYRVWPLYGTQIAYAVGQHELHQY